MIVEDGGVSTSEITELFRHAMLILFIVPGS